MTPDHDARTRLVVSWLREDGHEDAERVLINALNDVDHTPQRRSPWPARRFLDMHGYAKILAAAVAVVAVALLGITLLPNVAGPGGPSATPTSSPSPAPSVSRLPTGGALEPGTYRLGDTSVLITLPSGWDVSEGSIRKHRDAPGELALSFTGPDIAVYPDACANDVDPPTTGPTVDDLVAALAAQANSDATDPREVTVGALEATRVDVSVPEGLDLATCYEGILRIWNSPGAGYFAWGGDPSGEYRPAAVYMVDAPGGRLVFRTEAFDAAAADLAELDAILASLAIEE